MLVGSHIRYNTILQGADRVSLRLSPLVTGSAGWPDGQVAAWPDGRMVRLSGQGGREEVVECELGGGTGVLAHQLFQLVGGRLGERI